MTGSQGIGTEAFENFKLTFEGPQVDGAAQSSHVMVHTHTLDPVLTAVQDKSFCFMELKFSETD